MNFARTYHSLEYNTLTNSLMASGGATFFGKLRPITSDNYSDLIEMLNYNDREGGCYKE